MSNDRQLAIQITQKEIAQIKCIAHNNFLHKAVPKGAADDVQAYYLFQALRDYLISKGIDPGFEVK